MKSLKSCVYSTVIHTSFPLFTFVFWPLEACNCTVESAGLEAFHDLNFIYSVFSKDEIAKKT